MKLLSCNLTSTLRVCAAVLVLAGTLLAQAKPNFSGKWKLDKAKSTFNGGPSSTPQSVIETIDHEEPTIIISSTTVDSDGETKIVVKLTTDAAANVNIIGYNTLTSRSTWDGQKLVTKVKDKVGMEFTETRTLSKNGMYQTVEIFMLSGTKPVEKRVMVKLEAP